MIAISGFLQLYKAQKFVFGRGGDPAGKLTALPQTLYRPLAGLS